MSDRLTAYDRAKLGCSSNWDVRLRMAHRVIANRGMRGEHTDHLEWAAKDRAKGIYASARANLIAARNIRLAGV